ncbi:MAG: class I SAM-dependent RNA methyltransferase [Roseiflexaceae bacterium]
MTIWPAELELTLESMAQGGEGVGRWNDRVVFARGGLPGERVRVQLTDQRPSYARGAVIDVLSASADRTAEHGHDDDHMPWQHIGHAAQLRFKQQILAEQLSKIGGLTDPPVQATQRASQPWHYRTTAKLHCDGHQLGYYAADTTTIQPIQFDRLLHPALNDAIGGLLAAISLEPSRAPFEVLLRVSEADGYVLGMLDGPGSYRMLALRWRAACPILAGVAIGSRPPLIIGADHLYEEFAGLTFQLRPTSFFQVNVAAAETLLAIAEQGLDLHGDEQLIDLYCGVGAFTLPLARQVAAITGIESYDGAIADAEASAKLNQISNATFRAASVERELSEWQAAPPAAIVLDPPRRGCHPAAIDAILKLHPPRVVYISCQPATLARDLRLLVAGGYQIDQVTPVDLFPQTPHIESVTTLSLR